MGDCNLGWQNSIRHNLSHNEMFTKSTDSPSTYKKGNVAIYNYLGTLKKGKGSFWKLSQNQVIGLERNYPDCGFDKNKDSTEKTTMLQKKLTQLNVFKLILK